MPEPFWRICQGATDKLTKEQCAAYRRIWLEKAGKMPSTKQGMCKLLGEQVGVKLCPTCRGKVEVKIFACPIHGECTLTKALKEVACCKKCPDYQGG
jgi:hypothetical protein